MRLSESKVCPKFKNFNNLSTGIYTKFTIFHLSRIFFVTVRVKNSDYLSCEGFDVLSEVEVSPSQVVLGGIVQGFGVRCRRDLQEFKLLAKLIKTVKHGEFQI